MRMRIAKRATMHSTAASGGPRDPRFSLYSTDSEDQVTLAHRGLDRCAALLKSLLTPEKKLPEKQDGVGRKGARKQVQAKTSGKYLSRNKKDFPNPQTTLPKARFPGASKHLQPWLSSTPAVKHSRSKTEPRNVVKSSKREDTHSTTSDQGPSRQSGRKGPTVRHKRVRTEPHVIVCGSGNVEETSHRSSSGVPVTQAKQPTATCSNKTLLQAPTRGKPTSTAANSEQPMPPLHHYPYVIPSIGYPYPYPYHHHLWPPFTGQFGLPLHPQHCSPSLHQAPHNNPLQSHSYPLLPQHSPQTTKKPSPFVSRKVVSRMSPHNPVTSQQQQSTVGTPGHMNPVVSTSHSRSTQSHQTSKRSNSQLLQSLAQEMLDSFQQSLDRIRDTVGAGNSDLLIALETMGHSQQQYHDQLSTLFKQLVAAGPETAPSTADWLAQVHQLELEKSHLLERVIQSEMAYSDTKRQLDQEKKQMEDLRTKLETTALQLHSVKDEFQSMAETLSTQKKAMEEDIEKMKTSFTQNERLLDIKNAALQQQVNSLEQQLLKSREEAVGSEDQLSTVKCSLETVQEEIQMVKVSLMEKETELLQAQDQLLGLRQCLAYFLSEAVHLDTAKVSQSHYGIPAEAVQRFQSLVTDGNINSFLAAYTERTSEVSPLDITPQNSLPASPARSSLSPKCDHGSGMDISLEYLGIHRESPEGSRAASLQRKGSSQLRPVGSNTSPKSTISSRSNLTGVDQQSTVTTSSEVEFRKDLACLDADIARLQLQFRCNLEHVDNMAACTSSPSLPKPLTYST